MVLRDQGCTGRQAQGGGLASFAAKGKKVEFEVEVADGGTANLKAEIK